MDKDTVKITVYDREGEIHLLEAPTDMNLNLMEVLKGSGLDIKGTCGGMALCSTCHIYILSDHQLNEPTDSEEEMLDQAFDVEDNSRLGCQLGLKNKMDGLVIKIAPDGS